MLFAPFCQRDGRVRFSIVADPQVTPPGAVFVAGVATDPVLRAIYCALTTPLPGGAAPVEEPFDYAEGALETVSGGVWAIDALGGGAQMNVYAGGLFGNPQIGQSGFSVNYYHEAAADYVGKIQYVEGSLVQGGPDQWIGVNMHGSGATQTGYGVRYSVFGQNATIGWCNNGVWTQLVVVSTTFSDGDRMGVGYDPATPKGIVIWKNGAQVATHSYAGGAADGVPPGGTWCMGGIPTAGSPFSLTKITATDEIGVVPTKFAGVSPAVAADDVFTAAIRVSKAGIVYLQGVGVGDPTKFIPAGIGVNDNGEIVVASIAPNHWLGGVGFSDLGVMCGVDANAAPLPGAFSDAFSAAFD